MLNTLKPGVIALVLLGVGACANDERPRFISDRGVTQEVNMANGMNPNGDGLLYQFKLAADAARPFTVGQNPTLKTNEPAKQRAFMDAGFALIQARCNEYILSKADNQRQVNVWRDTFAPVTALLTGAVALLGKGDETNNDALTALSLGTSAASAGFRIYEQRFLFGAENVNSVRLLILKALSDNASQASTTTNEKLTYSQSVVHLINNQAVCSPGHILQLVSEAIEAGEVVSKKSDNPNPTPVETAAEAELRQAKAVIEQLKKDKVVTPAQVVASEQKVVAAEPAPPPPVTTPSEGLEIVTTKVQNNN